LGFPTLINRFEDYINAGILQNQLINGVEGAADAVHQAHLGILSIPVNCCFLFDCHLLFDQ